MTARDNKAHISARAKVRCWACRVVLRYVVLSETFGGRLGKRMARENTTRSSRRKRRGDLRAKIGK